MAGLLDYLNRGLTGSTSSYGGLLTDEDQKAAQQQAQLAMAAQLLDAGGWSPNRTSFGQAIGRGMSAAGQARQGSVDQSLQAALLRKQLEAANKKDKGRLMSVVGPDGKPVLRWESEAEGMTPHLYQGNEGRPSAPIQEYELYSQQAREAGQKPMPFMPWLEERAKANVGAPYAPMQVAGASGFGDRTNATFTPTSTAADEAAAAAARKAEEERAASLSKEQASRDATFENDINVLSDEIERTDRLLQEFLAGKYQTGPVAGKLPNWRTSAQNLSREQGKDTIKAISSATFGALSEGERAFLRELGVSENANEESNVDMLRERKRVLTRAKERLLKRPPLIGGQTSSGQQTDSQGRPPLSSFNK